MIENLTEPQKAYAAGFFDGEGSVYVSQGRILVNGHQYFLCASLNNTDFSVLEMLHDWYGGAISLAAQKGNRKATMRVRLYCQQAKAFLQSILPYLVIKKEQTMLAIDFQTRLESRTLTNEDKLSYKTRISQYNQKRNH
jgi:hypothetical protein